MQVSKRVGFTLIELIIVMLVVGILAAAGTPVFFDSLAFHRVESAARRIVVDLNQAKNQAVTTSSPQQIQFTTDSNSYVLPGLQDLNHPSESYSVDLSEGPYFAQLSSVDIQGGTELQFNHFGTANKDGRNRRRLS